MKSKKRHRLRNVVLCGMFILSTAFVFRGPIIATGLEWAVARVTKEELSYKKREWKENVLTFTDVKLGDFFQAEAVEFDLTWKDLLYIEAYVDVSRPSITINSKSSSHVPYLALLMPTRFFRVKWAVDEGVLDIPEQNKSVNFTFLSGERGEDLGKIIVSLPLDEEGKKTEVSAVFKQKDPGEYSFECDLSHLGREAFSFLGLKEEFDYGSGRVSGKIGGLIHHGQLREIQCDGIELTDSYVQLPKKNIQGFVEKALFSGTFEKKEAWKIASLEGDVSQGAISSQDWKGSDLSGKISIRNHTFQDTLLKGEFQGIPVEISFAGPVDAFEMTTEFVGDSKSWFDILMGRSDESFPSFPVLVKAVTQKQEHGYSVSGILEETINWGLEITSEGVLKQGWFFSQKCPEKFLSSFSSLSGDLSFYGTFDAEHLEAFLQGDDLLFKKEAFEVRVPHIGVKDPEFLQSEGWAHLSYNFSDKAPKIEFPLQEACVKIPDGVVEHVKGDLVFEEGRLKLRDFTGSYQDVQLKGDVTCFTSAQGVLEAQVKGEGFLEKLSFPLMALDNIHFDFAFDTQENKLKVQNLKAHLVDKNYDLTSQSLVYDKSSEKYQFDIKLGDILNLQGEGVKKSPSRMAFSLAGTFGAAFLDKVECEIEAGKTLASFSSKARFQGKDFLSQLELLEELGLISCDLSILDKVSTLEGDLEGEISFSPALGFLFQASGEHLKLDEEPIPDFELKGKKIAERWILEKMQVGDAELKGSLLKAQDKWFSPYWELKFQGVTLKGEALYEKDTFSFHLSKVEGLLPAPYTLRSEGKSPLVFSPTLGIKNVSLSVFKDGKKTGALKTDLLKYSHKLLAAEGVNFSVAGVLLPDRFSVSWETTAKTLRVQTEKQDEGLFISFADQHMEGKILGLKFNLEQKASLFTGHIKIEDGSKLSFLFPKELSFLKDLHGLELKGVWDKKEEGLSFSGDVFGKEVELKGYQLEKFQARLNLNPETIFLKDVQLSDQSGTLSAKQIKCIKDKETNVWNLSIPLVRGKDIRPSLLRKKDGEPSQEKPFVIRNVVFENLQGELGDLLSFTGQGFFNFTNAYKKEFSIFDTPLELIKNLGFDPALFTPISGEVSCRLKNGKFCLSDLKNTYSEGGRSQFYLAPDFEPSYIALTGETSINLRMKQDVVLKFGEPFALSIRGPLDDLKYKIYP